MNIIFVIFPYKKNNTWMFDDPKFNIVQEPFVSGIPEILDAMTKDIPKAKKGFKLIFSSKPFPDHTVMLEKTGMQDGGTWYECKELKLTGWLCPVLNSYFYRPPKRLFAKAEKI